MLYPEGWSIGLHLKKIHEDSVIIFYPMLITTSVQSIILFYFANESVIL